jgi:hypothetical protein
MMFVNEVRLGGGLAAAAYIAPVLGNVAMMRQAQKKE